MNTDLKARAEALLAALKVDGFRYIAGRPLDDLPWLKEALAAFMEAADAATVLNLIRERDEAREALETIANLHIPDQPAHFSGDELEWAQRHVSSLRRIAIEALTKEPTDV